ncbi:RE1, partial [Symbiodinium microadriaticum]
ATETMIAEVVEGHRDEIHFVGAAEEALMSSLVSSPGFGVIDSGCGKTLIGADTLAEMELLLGNRQVIKVPERNSFRFGNGEAEDSVIMAQIPVAIQGKTGVIHAAVIRGKAPLLLGRPTLEKLKMTVNFASGTVTMLGGPDVIQLDRNSAGQMLINLVQFPSEARQRSKGSVVSEALPVSPETPQAIGDDRPAKRATGLMLSHPSLTEAEERMSLEGFECLAGEAPAGSHTAAEPAPAQANRRPADAIPARPSGAQGFNEKVLSEVGPESEEEWKECVTQPRLRKDFESGQWVAYWRTQKSIKGQVVRACRWYGPALVLGRVGRNLIVAHRRSLLRCAPEQLRPATDEECPRTVESDPEAQELLGMKRLLDQGKIPQSQLTDITSQEFPPTPEECSTPLLDQVDASMDRTAGLTAAQVLEQVQAEDLSDMLRELPLSSDAAVPSAGLDSESPRPSSPREPAFKRMASSPPDALRAMSRQESAPAEALFCQTAMSAYREQVPHATEIEVLLAGFLQKQMQKEIPVTGNPEDLQEQVEEAKATEWYAMTSKPAVKVWSGADATRIRRNHPDRFVGSRFVVTRKVDEDGERVKARWCLQGHLDPDVMDKVSSGACHSPTMSQLSRSLLLQILVSKRWRMCLGDIKGAFLEAGPLKERFRPLYATQPKGGIPGLAESDVIEVTGNVYGLNDAPFSWWEAFDKEARRLGFSRSQFDNCVYYFRCPKTKELTGVLGAHVDDSITGGEGEAYEEAIRQLKARFPYRKWRVGAGEFCGVVYNQDPVTFEISYQQREYTQHLRPISLSKDRAAQKDSPVTARELASLRALNGAASWLASQSRPDIAVQAFSTASAIAEWTALQ